MRVEVIEYTPNPERVIYVGARRCYSDKSIEELKSVPEDRIGPFLKNLASKGHFSPFEHASFTFTIEGISRVTSHQLVRHRIASYSQQSQRYVKEKESMFVVPPSIAQNKEALEIYNNELKNIFESYNKIIEVLGESKREDARYIMPNATPTNLVMTMNVRELYNFFRLRLDSHAQWEIRELAAEILEECRKISPVLFENVEVAE